MSIRIRQLLLAALIQLLRLGKALLVGLKWLLVISLDPLYIAMRWVLRPLVIFCYTQYLKVMARLKRSAFMRNKVLFIFGNRYFIHVLVVMLAFFVASTNILQAKEIQGDTVFAEDSTLFKIVNPEGKEVQEITEKGLLVEPTTTVSYVNKSGMMEASIANLDPTAEAPRSIGQQLAILDNGSALLSTTAAETGTGNRSGIIEYKIKDGDTIGEIADRFGLSVNTLLWANSLSSSSYIRPGNTLKIPPASGVVYKVVDGDTLDKIIDKYKGNKEETMRVNDIGADGLVAVGTEIVIVDGTPPPPPTPTVTSYIASRSSGSSATATYQASNLPNYVTAGQFNYPVGCRGAMTTYWGHAGRGRDLPCPFGTPIYAAMDGTIKVNSTGYGGGYGNSLNVYSAGGIMTRYAHMNAFAVSDGQAVSRGQVIGYVGMTGRTSGPHLHFEIWINGVAYDPINYLR